MFIAFLLASFLVLVVSGQDGEHEHIQLLKSAIPASDFPTPEEQQEALDIHNSLRRAQNASNMQDMTWNDALAAKAVELSQACVFEHAMQSWDGSPYSRVGQNLYLGTTFTYTRAIQAWYDEIQDYDYETRGCSAVCGHYTQVVWDESRELGCGAHFCESALNPRNPNDPSSVDRYYNNVHIVTCNYGPQGNLPREPFQLGPPCTACSGGTAYCKDGLCDADCEGSTCSCEANCEHGQVMIDECKCHCDVGWFGPACDVVCEDTHGNCGANPGWPKTRCTTNYVHDFCPSLCGLCLPALPEGCQNTHEFCGVEGKWPSSTCDTFDYVRDYCPVTCGTC